jgi:hypothetical protein
MCVTDRPYLQIDGDTVLATHTFKIYQKSEEQHIIQSVAVSDAQPEITPEKLQEECAPLSSRSYELACMDEAHSLSW